MSKDEAMAIADRVERGDCRIDWVVLYHAERVLEELKDSRYGMVQALRIRRYHLEEYRAGLL